ncbi:MAG TPA: carboxylate-amine ligase [Steroidobacteraceae bacterium]|jgi:carboxylate-amine ligase|nr:carboxylate-amine ligase [Steroidobacteraceae bacterium]
MSSSEPPFTVGIQEEYLLVRLDTRDVDENPPAQLIEECTRRSSGQVSPRFLRSQLEASTTACRSIAEARAELACLRGIISEVGAAYGCAPIAASTHPFAKATRQIRTDREQFFALAKEMQGAARRIMICGMRVHVGVDDDDLRVDLMNQLTYFVPHLLALSCSSPFWDGEPTGLMSFRMTLLSSLPRTGLPERFASYAELRRHLDMLVRNGMIEHTGKMWWDVRPASLHPTLEVRVMDSCTSIDDAACLAALIVSLARRMYRMKRDNRSWRIYPNMLIAENRWRAMRYSTDGELLDLARGELVAFPQLVAELITLVREDAAALGCLRELEHLETLLERGTSAHRQIRLYEAARAAGASGREALLAVVDFLVKETTARLAVTKAVTAV